MPNNDRIEIETFANAGDGPAGKPPQSATSVAPSSKVKFAMLIVIFGTDGLVNTIPEMFSEIIMLPCATALTNTTFVHDVLIVKFARGSVVFTKLHGPHNPVDIAAAGNPFVPITVEPFSTLQIWYIMPAPLTTVPWLVALRHIHCVLVQLFAVTVMVPLRAIVSEPWNKTHVSFPLDDMLFDAHRTQLVFPIHNGLDESRRTGAAPLDVVLNTFPVTSHTDPFVRVMDEFTINESTLPVLEENVFPDMEKLLRSASVTLEFDTANAAEVDDATKLQTLKVHALLPVIRAVDNKPAENATELEVVNMHAVKDQTLLTKILAGEPVKSNALLLLTLKVQVANIHELVPVIVAEEYCIENAVEVDASNAQFMKLQTLFPAIDAGEDSMRKEAKFAAVKAHAVKVHELLVVT